MALSDDHKKRIVKICRILEKAIEIADGEENLPIDMRAIDAIDIALSLLSQQVELGLEYMDLPAPPSANSEDDTDDDEELVVAESADKVIEMIENSQKPLFDDLPFKFLEKEDDAESPSVDELTDWFNNPSFGEKE